MSLPLILKTSAHSCTTHVSYSNPAVVSTYKNVGLSITSIVPDFDREVLHQNTIAISLVLAGRTLSTEQKVFVDNNVVTSATIISCLIARKSVLVAIFVVCLGFLDDFFEAVEVAIGLLGLVKVAYPDVA